MISRTLVALVLSGGLIGGVSSALAADDEESISGKLSIGKKYSELYYFGAESGDSLVWYFETHSPVGKAINAVCKPKRDCFISGTTRSGEAKPKGVSEATSGTWRILTVSKVSRKPID